jgi:hypothetical protein
MVLDMRHLPQSAGALGLLFLLPILAGCAKPLPPAGHWQGAYEDSGLMIVARLEIDSAGKVRVSAPNAIADVAAMSDRERADLRAHLESGLSQSWGSIAPLPLEFDGHIFHKPGGVAPQLEWQSGRKRMIMVFYSGNRASIRVPMERVDGFDAGS